MRLTVLFLGMFAVGVDGFVIAGILTPISEDLGVSVSTAGLLETSFALAVALLAPFVLTFMGSVKPRKALVASLILFTVFNLVSAFAPWFWLVLVARVLAAISVGVFTATAPVAASMSVQQEKQGRALAIVTSGMTAGIVLGVPIGIILTNELSWRWSFTLVAMLGLIAAIGCSTQFAGLPAPPPATMKERGRVVTRPAILLMLITLLIWMVGGYVLYIYMGPMLESVAELSSESLPYIFFGFGVMSIIGNLLGGVATDRLGVTPTLLIGLLGGGSGLALSSLFGHNQVGVVVAVLIWSLAGWMLTPPQQFRLLAQAPSQAPVLMSLNASALYLGMGLGGLIGGLVVRHGSLRDLGWVGSIFEAIAIMLVLLQTRIGSQENKTAGSNSKQKEDSVA
ncbi:MULTISPECIES: MFS transporter [Corynebacterium]|uniref:MFS transporter n=1 Tax=Corynebacterium TaxID=1716 RepID=UPI00264CF63A|nr:MFS transporter [Corynebacterium kefirresidentii]MDN8634747.1 MFS transporter [Corynebacterium kefirresidentii]